MKSRRMMGCLAASIMGVYAWPQAPDWNTAGNNINASEWLGADAGSIIPLQIRHDAGDQPIEIFSTGDAVPEVFLAPAITGFSYAGATGLDLSGNLGVGPDFSMTMPPLCKLQVSNVGGSPTYGYRSWMDAGLPPSGASLPPSSWRGS